MQKNDGKEVVVRPVGWRHSRGTRYSEAQKVMKELNQTVRALMEYAFTFEIEALLAINDHLFSGRVEEKENALRWEIGRVVEILNNETRQRVNREALAEELAIYAEGLLTVCGDDKTGTKYMMPLAAKRLRQVILETFSGKVEDDSV